MRTRTREGLIVAGLAVALWTSAGGYMPSSAAAFSRTRVLAIVNEATVFDATVDAALGTDAALNVVIAAQDAARAAGASDLDIIAGMRTETAPSTTVAIDVTTTHGDAQRGESGSDVAQAGSATTGDAIGGQVVSIVGSGTVSLRQRDTTAGVQTHTGTSSGQNDAS